MARERLLLGLAVACLLAAVGAIGYGAGQASDAPEVIRAQRFEVLDSQGRVRATLGAFDSAAHGLRADGYDTPGLADTYVDLVFRREDGKPVVILGIDEEEGTGLRLCGKREGEQAELAVEADGTCVLEMYGGEYPRQRISASVGPDGEARLSLHDADAERRALLAVGKDGRTSLVLRDATRDDRARLQSSPTK